MTQKELIEFCKENDPNYNKDASFKVMEPMWSIPKGIGGIGITELEFKNGFYVQIDTRGRKGFEHLEGNVFYFCASPNMTHIAGGFYNLHWKKYFIPLNDLKKWGKEITKEVVVGKGILEQIEEHVLYAQMPSEQLETMKEVFEKPTNLMQIEIPPIQKIHMQTMYKSEKSETSIIVTKSSVEGRIMVSISDEEEIEDIDDYYKFSFTKERFSNLVDLMIEARKDLLI